MIPIRKSGKPVQDVTSYRPVSLLSSLSKVFERIILTRMNTHIETNALIPDFQFGFRREHSASHQLLRVINKVKTGFNHSQSTGMVLLDLKYAFDTVWHDAVVYKMQLANFPVYLTKLVQSFLSNRTFSVKVNNSSSSERLIPAGVPQGSVLGPTIFNFFMADVPTNHSCTTVQFADDIAFLYTRRLASSVKKQLKNAVKLFSKYVLKWKLKLNAVKSESVFFTRRRVQRAFPRRQIQVDGQEIPWNRGTKYLGITR